MATLNLLAFDKSFVQKFLGDWYIYEGLAWVGCGYFNVQNTNQGAGLRFLYVTIPSGSTIDVAYLICTAYESDDEDTVRSKIVGEAVDSATSFDDLADYQARRGTDVGGANNDNRTVAEVLWDNRGAWVQNTVYNSPEIKTIIKEIIDRGGWTSGNHIGVWWDDHAGRGTTSEDRTQRWAKLNVYLHIEFTPPTEERYFAWII